VEPDKNSFIKNIIKSIIKRFSRSQQWAMVEDKYRHHRIPYYFNNSLPYRLFFHLFDKLQIQNNMAFISATAPEVSWEEWLAEISGLDEQEKEMVNGDLNGTAAILCEPPDFLQQALVNMETALLNIPCAKKRDYVSAMEAAPHLVQEESNPLAFLRAACYNSEVSEEE
jgi:hypothetical protein